MIYENSTSREDDRPVKISDDLIIRAACRFCGRNRNQFAIVLKVVCEELSLIQMGCTLKDYIEFMISLGVVYSVSAIPDCCKYYKFLKVKKATERAVQSGKISPKVKENLLYLKNCVYEFIKENI